MNPYKWLADTVKTNLQNDTKLDAADCAQTSWMAMVEFANTKFVVGRGGVNTCWWKIGEGKQKFGYPSDLLKMLESLSTQKHIMYKVHTSDGIRRVLAYKKALEITPNIGGKIEGILPDDSVETVLVAKRTIGRALKWVRPTQ